MHELSIALSLVDAIREETAGCGAGLVIAAVHVRIGALAGVVPEALQFSFDVAAEDSPVAGAHLVIERVPVTVQCDRCGMPRELESPHELRCPVCAMPTPAILGGRELELVAVEVVDDNPNR
jgi:hydrogenase nickel incorporation protein HypA/HybF